MLKTIPQYLSAISDTYGLTKTLGVIGICTNANGEPDYRVGNNSIIFRIHYQGADKMLKCYTRDKRNLHRIYGPKCLQEELYIHSDYTHGEWVDVILDDWIEGKSLHRAILDNRNDAATMRSLAQAFDRMALQLLDQEWAHGDLKPENIIVTSQGELRLIDFDAMFLPEFAGKQSEECGTAAFQHPARTIDYFNKSIDDYPIALISTALHALAADPTLAEHYNIEDILLFDPKEILRGTSRAYTEVLSLFATKGMALQYRIAKLLEWSTPQLLPLRELMGYTATALESIDSKETAPLKPKCKNRLWGYCRGEKFVIPPIYDLCFDFCDGIATLYIGEQMHHINTTGSIVVRPQQNTRTKTYR